MREIKFMAWDKENKTMLDMDTLAEDWGFCIFYQHEVDHGLEMMQYIGLEDINGKEIYEGDIVEVKDPYPTGVRMFTGVVMFDNGSFMIKSSVGEHYRWLDYEVEVIGNVYENPELLEERL
jgi:uncharacterized phage protein (TIGR01671 family)